MYFYPRLKSKGIVWRVDIGAQRGRGGENKTNLVATALPCSVELPERQHSATLEPKGILKNNSTAGKWHLKILLNRRRSTFSRKFTSLVDKPYQASTLMRILLMNKEFHTNIHKKKGPKQVSFKPFFVLVLFPLVHIISAKYLAKSLFSIGKSPSNKSGQRWPCFPI